MVLRLFFLKYSLSHYTAFMTILPICPIFNDRQHEVMMDTNASLLYGDTMALAPITVSNTPIRIITKKYMALKRDHPAKASLLNRGRRRKSPRSFKLNLELGRIMK